MVSFSWRVMFMVITSRKSWFGLAESAGEENIVVDGREKFMSLITILGSSFRDLVNVGIG
jgi:hypothetical protein